jgi:hypothetical protein
MTVSRRAIPLVLLAAAVIGTMVGIWIFRALAGG